jgi:hypothetical protein
MSKPIRVDLIDPSPWRDESRGWLADGFDIEAHLAWMTTDIKARGIINALHLYPKPDGRFEVLHGNNRLEVAKRLGKDTVPAELRSMLNSEDQRREYFIKSNGHQHWAPGKVAKSEWLRTPKRTVQQIADMAGVSTGTAYNAREAAIKERPELFKAEKLEGADGKERPRTYKPRATGSRQTSTVADKKPAAKPEPDADVLPIAPVQKRGKLGGGKADALREMREAQAAEPEPVVVEQPAAPEPAPDIAPAANPDARYADCIRYLTDAATAIKNVRSRFPRNEAMRDDLAGVLDCLNHWTDELAKESAA